MHQKFGLQETKQDDSSLFDDFFTLMQDNHADFTLSFRQLGNILVDDPRQDEPIRDLFLDRFSLDQWLVRYRSRLIEEASKDQHRQKAMHAVNPKYILRNYLAQVAIEKAQEKDFSEVNKLLEILEHPFDEQPDNEAYAELPPDWASKLEVSCSS